MRRFLTKAFLGVTLLNLGALVFLFIYPPPHPALSGLFVAAAMAPFYFVVDSLKKAMPRANKPPDDGMYSISGTGLQANAEPNDWNAVAFYSAYACLILACWVIQYHYVGQK